MLIVSSLGCGKTTVSKSLMDCVDLDVYIKKECYGEPKYISLLRDLVKTASSKGYRVLLNMQWFLLLFPCGDFNGDVEFYFPKNLRSKIIYDREINKIGKERTEKLIAEYEKNFFNLRVKAKVIADEIGWKFVELADGEFLGDVL